MADYEKYFLAQIKRNKEAYTKGVVVHDTLNDALNGFHAYLGAYGYGKEAGTDYVACYVMNMSGAVIKSEVDDRIPRPEPPEPEPDVEPELPL